LQGTYYANVAGDAQKALEQFRNAVQYAPDNPQYQTIVKQLEAAINKANQPKSSGTKSSGTKSSGTKSSGSKPKSGGK